MPLTVEEVGQVVLALLPTRLQGLVGVHDTLSLPVMLTLYLSGDFGVLLFWNIGNFGNFGIFLSEEENGRPFSAWQKWQSYN